MTMLAGVMTLMLLSQTADASKAGEAKAAETTPSEVKDPSERAALAAERAAVAAEKVAAAADRLADAMAGPVEKKDAGPAKPQHWKGLVGAGFTFLNGNSQLLTITGNVGVDGTWEKWAVALRAAGAYGVSNPDANVSDSTAQITARKMAASARGDRTYGFASLFVLGGAEFDHVKNVEAREFGEVGTGLTFLNEKRGDLEHLFLRLDLAMRAGYETRVQYFPFVTPVDPYAIIILAPRAALAFRWAPNKDVRFSEECEAIPSVLAPTLGRLLVNSTTKLNARLTETVSLTTAFIVNYDSMPPPSVPKKLSTDIALTAGLEATF